MSTADIANSAYIKAERTKVYAKFEINLQVLDVESGASFRYAYSCNSDALLPSFHSNGSNGSPPQATLSTSYPVSPEDFTLLATGFDSFTGIIGAGNIFIKTGKQIVIKGAIEGGPAESQNIRGSGTWVGA